MANVCLPAGSSRARWKNDSVAAQCGPGGSDHRNDIYRSERSIPPMPLVSVSPCGICYFAPLASAFTPQRGIERNFLFNNPCGRTGVFGLSSEPAVVNCWGFHASLVASQPSVPLTCYQDGRMR